MNPVTTLALLIADLYGQLTASQARVTQLQEHVAHLEVMVAKTNGQPVPDAVPT